MKCLDPQRVASDERGERIGNKWVKCGNRGCRVAVMACIWTRVFEDEGVFQKRLGSWSAWE